MVKKFSLFIISGVMVLALSCATKVEYGDSHAVETLTVDFGSTDLQLIAEKMVSSMLEHRVITQGNQPVVFVSHIKNKTMDHIDTKSITDKVRTALLRSDKVRFTATSDIPNEILDQLEYQQDSGLVDPRTGKKYGRQIGADFILYGEITSIEKKRGRIKDVYYKITFNLANIETGLIDWADEKEIRKGEKRPTFGL